ncbi:chemotaxis protein [Sulfurimonas sp. MAG313]|nr:chemotaxis protein [Sulfurimonas sp. MAG313]MDF1880626.1 chemotaxis protein [Sulfurimonas sp. MAG313]
MTQEELDALMGEDVDLDEVQEEASSEEATPAEDEEHYEATAEDYKVSATHNWPPPPPTDDNKMVHQLDDVTKESEEKASEIFDHIEKISDELMEAEGTLACVVETFDSNIELFKTLSVKFPDVEAFKTQLEKNETSKETVVTHIESLQTHGDSIMSVMDIMQYQDIHRQKIERVINVMRALSTYMNELFSGNIDDSKRVASARHLPGDSSTEEVVSTDEIEALLASFEK